MNGMLLHKAYKYKFTIFDLHFHVGTHELVRHPLSWTMLTRALTV